MLSLARDIRKIKKDLGLKGWTLQMDEESKPYLSKFGDLDDKDNENEYRIYFLITKDKRVLVTRKIFIPKYRFHQRENVENDNRYIIEAREILKAYKNNHLRKTLAPTLYFEVKGVV